MDRFTKAQRKKLRKLAGVAWECELDQELEKLYQQFLNWRNKKIDGFELNQLIHDHHQGPSQEIWKFYTYAHPDTAVARGLNFGFLKKAEVPQGIYEIIERKIGLFDSDDEDDETG